MSCKACDNKGDGWCGEWRNSQQMINDPLCGMDACSQSCGIGYASELVGNGQQGKKLCIPYPACATVQAPSKLQFQAPLPSTVASNDACHQGPHLGVFCGWWETEWVTPLCTLLWLSWGTSTRWSSNWAWQWGKHKAIIRVMGSWRYGIAHLIFRLANVDALIFIQSMQGQCWWCVGSQGLNDFPYFGQGR